MRHLLAAVLAALLAMPASAEEGGDSTLGLRTLASAGTLPVRAAAAPYRVSADPLPEILLRQELGQRTPRGTCDISAAVLCYDVGDRRVQFRPARRLMPEFEGLRAESLSLRSNGVVFKYSFR